ncbi:MAG: rod shape-determining protein RodA [Pseudomonadota bacterium]|nr:rod shape-determining protein RodA [Pseudomonadota bacterium]
MTYFKKRSQIDYILLSLVSLGICIGLLLLLSANQLSYTLPLKQVVKGSLAIAPLLILFTMSERNLKEITTPAYIFSILLLVAVFWFGDTSKGATRWLNFYFFRFEPSELVKITLPLVLASHIHHNGIPIKGRSLFIAILMVLVPFILVLKQPDLGTALIILFIGSLTIFIAGLNRKVIALVLVTTLLSAPLIWNQLHPYQQQRVLTLMNTDEDLKHHGYHINQSKIAIGSGGLWGKGFGKGTQVQLGYIPEHKTDFIFTVLSEEFGFIGNIFWIMLVLTIGFRCIYLGYKQAIIFNKLVCIALGSAFMLNAWINMSMVSGLLPVVGIPLPLLSYGGTSFVATIVSFGIILKLGHTDPKKQYIW